MKANTIGVLICYSLIELALGQANSTTFDVLVIGAGLSGLAAARKLIESGKKVAILEGRDRVGGRVQNQKLRNGGVTELGAAFVGPTQDRVLALADELGLETFPTYNEGSNVAVINGKRSEYPTWFPVPAGLDWLTKFQFLALIAKLDLVALTIDVRSPWEHLLAKRYDDMSFRDWSNNIVTTSAGRQVLSVATEAIWSAKPEELSFLYVLSYIAGAGNPESKGNFQRLISTSGGSQESRIEGGTGLLPMGLADKIGREKIILNMPVESVVRQESGKYLISGRSKSSKNRTAGTSFTATNVVVAMSPPVANRIRYSPPVPFSRRQLMERMFMGSIGKANAIYETPFWREKHLTGQVLSTSGTVQTTFDDSDADGTYGAILGFIEADQMRALNNATNVEIQNLVVEDYVKYFGEQARNVSQWVIKRWDNEEFSLGGPTALAGPGTFRQYGPALRTAYEGLHWAGTEAATFWPGYMDGAISSGERAAAEIIGQ